MRQNAVVASITLLVFVVGVSGCSSFWHELKPHRLHKLNSGAAPSLDPEFGLNLMDADSVVAYQRSAAQPSSGLTRTNWPIGLDVS